MRRFSREAFRTALLCFGLLFPFTITQAQPKAELPLPAHPPPPGVEAQSALGSETSAILLGATRVQAVRLLTNTHTEQSEIIAQFQGHASGFVTQGTFGEDRSIDHAGPDQGKMFVAQADRILFDNELYDLGGLSKCFDPGVGLRFWKGTEHVDVALCFECAQLSIATFDAHNKLIRNIPQLAMGFDQPLFVHLILPVFPRDAEIQAIKAYSLPPEVETPEARAAQEDDIREAIFRHLITERETRGDTAKCVYFLSIGPSDRMPVDPDRSLLDRFSGDAFLVRPESARHAESAQMRVVFLRTAHLWWIEPTTVYAEAAYGTASDPTKTFTYRLTKISGHWTVTDDTPGWRS